MPRLKACSVAGTDVHLLLDTHVALWALTDDPRLRREAKAVIVDEGNSVAVSTASIWEIAIKHALGKGGIPFSAHESTEFFKQAGYRLLAVTPRHAVAVEALPELHRDPFDRMLVAQALTEPLCLVTHDGAVAAYLDTVMLI